METLSPNPAIQDLKLTFQQSTLVFPSQQTHQHKTFFLSNIDQSLHFNLQLLYFFSPNPDFPPQTLAARLKLAIQKVLVPYDFMAGRLNWNHHTARLDLLCNAAGAGFVAASSPFSLDEIGDLACPNPAFRQLAVQTLNNLEDQPLSVFQVTSFRCGGFAIGVSLNHVLLDGLAGRMFLENLASQAFQDKPLAAIPCHDRHLLAARTPPLVSFPHPEFLKPQFPVLGRPVSGSKQELEFKVFKISSSDVNFLKAMAAKQAAADNNATPVKITTFNVIAALIWRCRALSLCDVEGNKDRVFSISYAVDMRSRLNPPLPPEYCGNAILPAYASAKCRDMEKWPLWKLVEMISEGIARMSDEYVKSAIDWLEINKGIPYGDCILTSWLRLGLNEVVFPWGKALHCCLVVNNLERLCWMIPHVDGVNILIQRPAQEMDRFTFHLRNSFLA